MALKRTVLETYKSQRGRRYGKRHWLKTMASHVGHVGSGHNASGLCLDNGPTSWTKKSHCAASTVLNIHRDYWCRWHCQIIDQGHWSLSRAEKILIQYLGLECIVDSTVFIFFFNCGYQLQLGHWCNFATNYRRIFFFFFTHRTLSFNIPQTSWFPRHNPNDQDAWLSRRKKRRDASKHATHHPIQHNPGC